MDLNVVLPGLTALFGLVMAAAVLDQWRLKRRPYQLAWAIGMFVYGAAAATEFLAAGGWTEALYRVWYATGALWTAAWLGAGTVLLLSRTRFGYTLSVLFLLAGVFSLLGRTRYEGASTAGLVYFGVGLVLAVAIAWLTYLGSERWARLTLYALLVGTIVSAVLVAVAPVAAPGYAINPTNHVPVPDAMAGSVRLLALLFNLPLGLSLVLGAIFSAYIFMPKRRVLAYNLSSDQKGDEFLFNLAISLVAIPVNFAASLPDALRDLVAGRLHSRVGATILIALGGFVPSLATGLERFGITDAFFIGQFIGVIFLLAGFLASIEVFNDFRVPFTSITFKGERREAAEGKP